MNLSDIGKRRIAFCNHFLTEAFTKAEIAIYRKIIHLFRYSNSLNFIRYVLRALCIPFQILVEKKKYFGPYLFSENSKIWNKPPLPSHAQ